jgi:hypothetical protein
MCSILSQEEKRLVDEHLLIHTLETGDDSFLHLNIAENQQRAWTGVIFDVLRDYSVDSHTLVPAVVGRLRVFGERRVFPAVSVSSMFSSTHAQSF